MKSSARTATKVLMQWLTTQALLEITPHITTYRLCTAYIASGASISPSKAVHSEKRWQVIVRLVIAKRNADSSSETIFRSCWWEFNSFSIYRKASTLRFLTSPLYERTQTTLHFCQFPFGHLCKSEGEMAKHTHKYNFAFDSAKGSQGLNWGLVLTSNPEQPYTQFYPDDLSFYGNNQPHNNIPPAYGVYRFRRTTWCAYTWTLHKAGTDCYVADCLPCSRQCRSIYLCF